MNEFTVSLSEDDLYRAFRLHAANRASRPLLLLVALLIVLLVLVAVIAPGSSRAVFCSPEGLMLLGAVSLALLLVMLVLALRGPMLRATARKTLSERRDLGTPIAWSYDDDALRITSRFSAWTLPWDAVVGWRENADTLLVYVASQAFHAVPKTPEDDARAAGLRAALERQGVPRR